MEKSFKITNSDGLHARPSALLVSAVSAFTADVQLSYKGKCVNLKSIMGVMSQGVGPGSVITISAEGVDAENVIRKVSEIINTERLGEEC